MRRNPAHGALKVYAKGDNWLLTDSGDWIFDCPATANPWDFAVDGLRPTRRIARVVVLTSGHYLSLISASFIGGVLLGWLIWR